MRQIRYEYFMKAVNPPGFGTGIIYCWGMFIYDHEGD